MEKFHQTLVYLSYIDSLSVPIGKTDSGLTTLDLHEKFDGPHMLVAGTTGSGKSETIISYLLGLCLCFRPDEVNLMLVDMKGGGFVKRIGMLPHVVGSVTDVDGDEEGTGAEYMLKRFLDALSSEIRRRKILFNSMHVDNINDYIKVCRDIDTHIKSLNIQLHENVRQDVKEEIYIIDFGGNLGEYGRLGLVSACFDSSNEENVRRIFKAVENAWEKNIRILRSNRFIDVFGKNMEEKPTHITLMIDNVTSFLADERYIAYQEMLQKFCRDGLSKGLSVVLTASDVSGGLARYLGSFGQKIAFEVSKDMYIEIFGVKVNKPMNYPGRGVTIVDGVPREFHCFRPFENEKEDLELFIKKTETFLLKPEKLQAFEPELTFDNLKETVANHVDINSVMEEEKTLLIGLDYYQHLPVTVNFDEIRSIAIYGKKKFGKTNLLRLMLREIREKNKDYRIVFFDDGRKQLQKLYEEDQALEGESIYINNLDQFDAYLNDAGYLAAPKKMQSGIGVPSRTGQGTSNIPMREAGQERKPDDEAKKETIKKAPFTIFVLQSKMLFQGKGADAFKDDATKVKSNITGIYDILKTMCDTLEDCRKVFSECDKALGEYNRNPSG